MLAGPHAEGPCRLGATAGRGGAQGKPEQFPALAHELVRLKVDVIVAPNDALVVAAQNNRTRVPEGSVLPIQVVSGV